ncbi:hypothetical protein AU210_016456 [Fusarium oxysporum f. sp. radicis-cucumerinum]|uniref:Uncharacterized protein n=1 Tax=Fusarium oxysporum f. sp. radicis-cucumerinum TaxID=327505 RepID=A0A2H3G331_FUSOX|nr:hypothetical protein AU210_016456 [Fusarium oxysporum f. sp. radicis-cucumerinum]
MEETDEVHNEEDEDDVLRTSIRTIAQNTSAIRRKRKQGPRRNHVEDLRRRRRKLKRECCSFKVISISLPNDSAARGETRTWEYKWNTVKKLWTNEGAPQEMRKWRAEELCMMLDYLTVKASPKSGLWNPVEVQWRNDIEDEHGMFEWSDSLENWIFQITYEVMIEMLGERARGVGIVIK